MGASGGEAFTLCGGKERGVGEAGVPRANGEISSKASGLHSNDRQWGAVVTFQRAGEGRHNSGDFTPPRFQGHFYSWVEARVELARPNRRLLSGAA